MLSLIPSFLDPENLLDKGGLALLTLIVFAESGLLVGFFLPGDSLLFFAGFLSSAAGGRTLPGIGWIVLCVVAAAIAGDQVGYLFGRRVGPALFDRPKSRVFNPANAVKAQRFFERHGAKTIVLARFVPIVRTFAPIVAGVSTMKYRTFATYNVVGGLLWGAGVTIAGYYLGEIDLVKDHVEIAAVAIVAISLVPIAFEIVRHRRQAAQLVEPVAP